MRKIVLEIQESLYDRLACLALSQEKNFSQLVTEIFEKDAKTQELYDELVQKEFEQLTKEAI